MHKWQHIIREISYRVTNHVIMVTCVCLLCYPLQASHWPTLLERIKLSGTLTVASRNGPTTYYQDNEGYTGFDYELLRGFAESIGVTLQVIEIEDLGLIFKAINRRTVHMAAAGLTVTPKRQQLVHFSEPYLQVTQQLIYRSNSPKPAGISDIIGKDILVIGNSSHAERLRAIKKQYPDLVWQEQYDIEMLDLMESVHNQKVTYAIVDSNALEMNSSAYPRALAAFDISEPESLAWALPKMEDNSLVNAANHYLKTLQSSGKLAEITESFYGHVGHIDYSGALIFTKRLRTRLPKWQAALQAAAQKYDLDWQLLAALSYQESHWNPKAKSRTGVRGFMMLTLNTSKEMGVKSRLDPLQSIEGGAKYFRKMYDRLSDDITEPDRTWLALAAYNIGFLHLQDARKITQDQGGNPNLWSDVRERLPLLTKRQYYKKTRYGYARGHEAVSYVNNIRNFYNVIAWKQADNTKDSMSDETSSPQPDHSYESIISSALEELEDINAM
ncbi:membrane-bound lytic murein transglycosylase MltF [Marinagarivorans algicola]|uniref:membrane-bound lytic murein transglycosylase MltF n=1 Tax=Marinagarivorans algicola TaxID=1513270 RepID=UPI0009E6D7EA|nr:membrane-bound lytic murein transglycosylase MltF [Marinagarivorans algicola]